MRSWLFVPADSERKLARAFDTGADVVILDLERRELVWAWGRGEISGPHHATLLDEADTLPSIRHKATLSHANFWHAISRLTTVKGQGYGLRLISIIRMMKCTKQWRPLARF